MMIEIAVASGKGGVGKSTVSTSMAIYLSRRKRNVVAIDADADAANFHLILGEDRWDWKKSYSDSMIAKIIEEKCIKCGNCLGKCSYKAIYIDERGNYRINPILCEGCLTCTLVCPVRGAIVREKVESGKLYRVNTKYGFPLISASLNPGRPNSGKLVTEEKELAKEIAEDDSIIIIDSAAGIGCQVVSSLAGANMVILVAEPTPASFNAIKRVHVLTKHFMQPVALVINKYDINLQMSDTLEDFAQENNIDLLGKIPYDESIPKSMASRVPVIELFPDSPAAKALINISAKVEYIIDNWYEWFIGHRPKKPEPYKPIIIKPVS